MNDVNPYQHKTSEAGTANPDATPEGEAAVIAKLNSLGFSLRNDIPYRLEKMFPRLDGFGVKGQIKRRAKMIKQVEPHLDSMLLQNEEILYIAKGVQHSLVEAMTIGALWSNMINQTVFILTTARIIMAHCLSLIHI